MSQNLPEKTEPKNSTIDASIPLNDTHSKSIGYITWILGFMGAHRFYYGKQVTGTIWFFTLGLLFIGWIVDLFLIPKMDAEADRKYTAGQANYTIGWVLLTFLWMFGAHRFYLRKWVTGIIWLCTGGLFFMGFLYDLWTYNRQVSEYNEEHPSPINYNQM